MTDTRGDETPIAAEYALGLLDGEERAAFEEELQRNPALRVELVHWQEHFASLAEGVEEVAPPRTVWQGIKQEAWNEVHQPWHRRVRLWEFAIGGAAAALVAYAALELDWFGADVQPPEFRAEISSEESGLQLVAQLAPELGLIQIERAGVTPAAGRALELWIIAGGNAPVSLGLLPDEPIGVISVSQEAVQLFADGALLAVSDEPAGGSPTGAPTGAVLGAGPVQLLTNL